MKLETGSFPAGGRIGAQFAFCDFDAATHVAWSGNRNPDLSWSQPPDGTRSFVLLVHDSDVPSQGHDVNKEGREVPEGLARVDFFHWVLIDIPPATRGIAAGEFSDGVTARGKGGPDGPGGTRQGINGYTNWFAGDPDMEGVYHGYDGPCPPWNDSLIHHYHFTLYALDLDTCPVDGQFTGFDVRAAIDGHILAQTELVGTYTLNPRLR